MSPSSMVRRRSGLYVPRAAPPVGYAATILSQGATLHWKLDETTGTAAADATGNGHPGVYHGTPTLGGATIRPNGAGSVQLNSIAKYIDIAATGALNNTTFSFSHWLKLATNASYHNLVNRDGTSASRGWNLYSNAGKLDGYDGVGDHTSAGATLATGTAFHIGCTCDGTTVKFYVNGSLDFSFSAVFGWLSNGAAGGSSSAYLNALTLGASLSGTTGYNWTLDGNVQDFAYWAGSALSAGQMAAQYAAG